MRGAWSQGRGISREWQRIRVYVPGAMEMQKKKRGRGDSSQQNRTHLRRMAPEACDVGVVGDMLLLLLLVVRALVVVVEVLVVGVVVRRRGRGGG